MNEHNVPTSAHATAESKRKIKGEKRGAVHIFTLDRAEALNAFDDEMCTFLSREIPQVARNPDVYITALKSNSPKAFCAGGDVVALTRQARADLEMAKTYFRNEYALNWLFECYSKPTVSFINGLCMGSGAGLSAFNTHRVAGENYQWAMPETKIGLFPDVGISHVLAQMPWPVGRYLGLTGRRVGRADAQWLGLVTHCIGGEHTEGILDKLADAQTVDPMLDGKNEIQQPGPIQKDLALIQDHFSGETLNACLQSLKSAKGTAVEWASRVLAELEQCSPLSLAITDRHIAKARALDVRDVLIEDYRLAVRCLSDADFFEGVRAALVDKDKQPKWTPATLAEVTSDIIERYFAPLADDLVLPSRSEMQAARV